MSSATFNNVDVATRINSYLSFIIGIPILILVTIGILYSIFNRLDRSKIDENILIRIRDISSIGIVCILLSILAGINDFAVYIIDILVVLSLIFLIQKYRDDRIDYDMCIWSLLISIPFSIFLFALSHRYDIVTKLFEKFVLHNNSSYYSLNPRISDNNRFADNYILFSVLVLAVISITIYFTQHRIINRTSLDDIRRKIYRNSIIIGSIPILFSSIIQSIGLETMNIINKHYNIVFGRPRLLFITTMFMSVITSISLIVVQIRRNKITFNITNNLIYKLFIPVSIITLLFIMTQPYRMVSVGNEFFEMANHGLSVYQFFRFGKLPIIETFDAHMLCNQIPAYIYSFINGYEPWSAFLYLDIFFFSSSHYIILRYSIFLRNLSVH